MEEDDIKRKLRFGNCAENSRGNPEGKEQCARPRRGWEDNMKTILKETGCGGMDWI
jgi:hypothetical protein